MNILAISDIHERSSKLPILKSKLGEKEFKPDVVVVAGDLTYFKSVDVALRIARRIREVFEAKVVFVPGNCDPPELISVKEVGGEIINIHSSLIKIDKYVFAGIGGSGITPFNTMIEFTEEEFKDMIENIYLSTNRLEENLILVTHQPINGFFDDVGGVNVGSRIFREYLERINPLLWITGHIHENSGWVRVGDTIIVHPGPLMKGYFAVIKLRDNYVEYVEVGRI